MADSATAKATFELSNNIQTVPSVDAVFKYDRAKQQELLSAKPWEKELSSLSLSLSPFTCFLILSVQPSLLQGGEDFRIGSPQDGDACSIWGSSRGHGTDARQD